MTAAMVNGRAVVATEPAASPLVNKSGPVLFTRIVRLLLDDGSESFGCTECDFSDARLGVVRQHVGRAHGPDGPADKPAPKNGRTPPTAKDHHLSLTIGELLDAGRQVAAMTEAIERLANDRDQWKDRARKAEKRLQTLRTALGGES